MLNQCRVGWIRSVSIALEVQIVAMQKKIDITASVPFQFSLHVLKKENTSAEHFSFLAKSSDDPRLAFLSELKKVLGDSGSIIVYNQVFGESILKNSAADFPEHDNLITGIHSRLIDLLLPFRNFYYYNPQQKGSASIKNVLPALTDKGYQDLAISKGNDASLKFFAITHSKSTEDERNKVRAELEDHCALDTGGMLSIVDRLKQFVRG